MLANLEEISDRLFKESILRKYEFYNLGEITIEKEPNESTVKMNFVATEFDIKKYSNIVRSAELILENYFDDLVFKEWESSVFLLPAERAGLNLFFKELNAARNELIHSVGTKRINHSRERLYLDFSKEISVYAEPISDYLTFLNSLSNYSKKQGDFIDLAYSIQTDILKGNYEVQNNNIQYTPQSNNQNEIPKRSIGLHASSSTVKTLFGLVFYFTYMAQKGSTLIIDEPELNLHPDNQRKLARILAEATNRGLRVILSTHSDYIIKEFNNLIMLSNDFENRDSIMEKFGYTKEQVLDPKNIGAYMFANHTISEMEVNEREGIIAETFNEVINQYNDSNDEIYYAIVESEEHAESD